jgi:hypothetical protein
MAADPGPVPDEGAAAAMLDEIASFFSRFVVMRPHEANVLALFVVHTHAIEAAETTPFIVIQSPEKESGKTRTLEVADMLVRNPLRSVSMSAAALYSKVQEDSPTLLLDEIDAILNPKEKTHEELRGLLNAGNRRGAKAYRVGWEKNRRITESFEVFCPRMLAGIGRVPETIESRSFIIRLKRRTKDEAVERLGPRERRRAEPVAADLKSRAAAWAAASVAILRDADPDFPEGLRDREEEGAQPLLAIADLVGGEWPARARCAISEVCAKSAAMDSDAASSGARLLLDVRAILDEHEVERIFSKELADALNKLETAPWADWNRGKGLSQRNVADLLRPYGVPSKTIRIAYDRRKGYERVWFEDAWLRYCPATTPTPSPEGLESVTSETTPENTGESALSDAVTDPQRHGAPAVIARKRHGTENGETARQLPLVTGVTAEGPITEGVGVDEEETPIVSAEEEVTEWTG